MKENRDNNSIAIDFLMYSYFGITSACKSEEMIFACIKRAYLDACRTITFPNCDIFSKNDSKGYFFMTEVARVIYKKINEITGDYDEWHRSVCESIIAEGQSDRMNTFYGESIQLTYGHAQKWVNMTMKYLYLLEILLEKGYVGCNWEKLHVPIDSYVMEAFDRESKKKSKDILEVSAWSNIESEDRYKEYQEKIREIAKGETPVNWEGPAWISVAEIRSKKEAEKKSNRLAVLKNKRGLAE